MPPPQDGDLEMYDTSGLMMGLLEDELQYQEASSTHVPPVYPTFDHLTSPNRCSRDGDIRGHESASHQRSSPAGSVHSDDTMEDWEHGSTPRLASSALSFFSLPPELRNMIFREAFVNGETTFASQSYLECYNRKILLDLPIKSALLVSRRFSAEAKDMYYKENRFLVGVHPKLNKTENDTFWYSWIKRQGNQLSNLVFLHRGDLHLLRHVTVFIDWRLLTHNPMDWRNDWTARTLSLPLLETLRIILIIHKECTKWFAGALARKIPLREVIKRRASRHFHNHLGALSSLGPDVKDVKIEIWPHSQQCMRCITLGFAEKFHKLDVPDNFLRRFQPTKVRGLVDDALDVAHIEDLWDE